MKRLSERAAGLSIPLFRRSRFVSELGPGDTVITPASAASMAAAAAVSTSVWAFRSVAYNVFPFTRDASVYHSATYAPALYFSAVSPLSGDEARKWTVFSFLISLTLSSLSLFLPLSARKFARVCFRARFSSSYLFVPSLLLCSPLRFHSSRVCSAPLSFSLFLFRYSSTAVADPELCSANSNRAR